MKIRLLGAAVLIILAVVFVPMFFSGKAPTPSGEQSVSLAIPPAPDSSLQTRTMSLSGATTPPATTASVGKAAIAAPVASSTAPVIPGPSVNEAPAAGQANARAAGGSLATVNIADKRPRDVETEAANTARRETTTVTHSEVAAPRQPAAVPPAATVAPATAAIGSFHLNLSAYSEAGAARLVQRVRALGVPVAERPIKRAGRTLMLVAAGPFDSRAAAESARLKIAQSISGVRPVLESGASTPSGDAPAVAVPSAGRPARAGGFAVQVAAMGTQAEANTLRDKLRAQGFDGFVDSVEVGGRRLWRVRVGPQTQRADAERLRDQVKAKLGLAGNIVTVP